MNLLLLLLAAFRPKTLTAALIPCIAGTALAASQQDFWSKQILFFSLGAAFCIQIATNLFNDAIDFTKGADTVERVGPQRLSQSGELSPKWVLGIGFLFLLWALLLGLPLVQIGGWPILLLGVVSLGLAYAYTGGPFPLSYLGLGDIFVVLFFGLFAVGGIYFLQTQSLSFSVFILGLQVGFHCTVLIAINNLRDIHQDRQAQKKTWAVRFGEGFVKQEIRFLIYFPFLLNFFWLGQSRFFAASLGLLILPLAIHLDQGIWSERPGSIHNEFLAKAALLHFGFGALTSVGLWLS